MKMLFLLSCLIFLPFISNAQCEDLKLLVKEYKNDQYRSKVSNAGTKLILTQILKQAIGKSAGIITGTLNPSSINTPYDSFMRSLERIRKISSEEVVNWDRFSSELENLILAAEGVEIEKQFGNDKACYNDIHFIVKTYVLIMERAKKIQ